MSRTVTSGQAVEAGGRSEYDGNVSYTCMTFSVIIKKKKELEAHVARVCEHGLALLGSSGHPEEPKEASSPSCNLLVY